MLASSSAIARPVRSSSRDELSLHPGSTQALPVPSPKPAGDQSSSVVGIRPSSASTVGSRLCPAAPPWTPDGHYDSASGRRSGNHEAGGFHQGAPEDCTARAQPLAREDDFFFFQAEDGSSTFLHPVSVRCLLAQYGSLLHAPDRLEGVVLEAECAVVTPDARARQRYLSHVPAHREYVRSSTNTPRIGLLTRFANRVLWPRHCHHASPPSPPQKKTCHDTNASSLSVTPQTSDTSPPRTHTHTHHTPTPHARCCRVPLTQPTFPSPAPHHATHNVL